MSDPRADALRAGYATVARAYAEHLVGELAGKPLDRALLYRAKGKPEVRKAVLKIVKGRMGDSVGALE